jgi:DsbC/DsbD-like thiol-disulfide interchange protein
MALLQQTGQQPLREKEIVTVAVDKTFATPGKKSVVIIQVMVKEGYHIQANKVNDPSLIPVTLKISKAGPFSIARTNFPPYKLFRLEGTDKYLPVFDSSFNIRMTFTVPADTRPGRYIIKATLTYQACDARHCLFPRTIDFELPVVVVENNNSRGNASPRHKISSFRPQPRNRLAETYLCGVMRILLKGYLFNGGRFTAFIGMVSV